MKQYVIIGNGVAAVGCIEGIREKDREGSITVISGEPHPVYSRPLISYYLEGKTDLERIQYRDAGFYERNGCTVLYGKQAVSLDPAGHTVRLDDGSELHWDALCNATGSSPFVPPFNGLDTVEKKHSFMTLDDTLALEKDLTPGSRVLIVGAGLIGLKCAEGILNRVASVTVCDLAERVLSSILDDDCAAPVRNHLEEKGIRFLLGNSVESFRGGTAIMKNGEQVDFDILVLAVGVRANTGLIKAAGGEVGRGVVVNGRMETSLKDIYAAGDCTESRDLASGMQKVMAILPNACIQGRTAGINMAGGSESFDRAIPMNSIGFFGFHMMTAGSAEGELIEEKGPGFIRRFFVRDNLLKGFIHIGSVERTGIYTSLIREQIPLDSVDFDVMVHIASSVSFSAETRKNKFGCVI